MTVWMTGLAASGKTTLAIALEKRLLENRQLVVVLDGDQIRKDLCQDLGFSDTDRFENVRRIGAVARLFEKKGFIAVCNCISPSEKARAVVRQTHQNAQIPFIEVYVATPLSICEEWDTKNIYARARQGILKSVVGVDLPYEPPLKPELILRPDKTSLAENIQKILTLLSQKT